MTEKIYKYFSSNVFDLVFAREGFCGVKCSLPKDYNDPYELFLGVDLDVSTECLATYRDIIQKVKQRPTTCFSTSPIVSPMWAHYGENHSGFVLEFDVPSLKEEFKECVLREMEYRDTPNPAIAEILTKATYIMKPRHAIWLQQTVNTASYFTKHNSWSYEQEFRLVDVEGACETVDGNDILFIPNACVSSIILGSKFPTSELEKAKDFFNENKFDLYTLEIGKSYPLPFLTSASNTRHTFDGISINPAEFVCGSCEEPLVDDAEQCAWCAISEDHEADAARGNPLRMLHRIGHLDDYMAGVINIEGRRRR